MMRHPVVEIETAEPTIGEVEVDILAQLALEADAVAVADGAPSLPRFTAS